MCQQQLARDMLPKHKKHPIYVLDRCHFCVAVLSEASPGPYLHEGRKTSICAGGHKAYERPLAKPYICVGSVSFLHCSALREPPRPILSTQIASRAPKIDISRRARRIRETISNTQYMFGFGFPSALVCSLRPTAAHTLHLDRLKGPENRYT